MNQLLDLLNEPVADASLDVGADEGGGAQAPVELSPTALSLDQWSLRRGAEITAESEKIRERFSQLAGTDGKPGDFEDVREDAELATADFHAAAFEPSHEFAKACKNDRIKKYMQNLIETPEFKALHAETQLDPVAAEIATGTFVEQWVEVAKTADPGGIESDHQCRRAAAKALGGASKDIGDLRDAEAAMGIGGSGATPGKMQSDQLIAAFRRVRGSHQLKRIVELAGRYRRFAQAQQRKKVLHGRDDVVGVVMDGDVGRLLPHELVALTDPDLELDAMRRIVERQAMCREFRGIESKARGPIVVVVDESGSMSGEPVATAKAIALALAWIAQHQKRWYCLVGFSGGTGGCFCVAPPKGTPREIDFEEEGAEWRIGPDAVMNWMEHFYGGGTTLDVPLDMLPSQWDLIGAPKGKTDIICITDAQVDVSDKLANSFLAWKAKEQVKMISLIINCDPGDMHRVSDRVHRVKSLSLEEEGVQEVMTV